MRVARVQAQAKVNLGLKVFSTRDEQGYHMLLTTFQRIDLADDVVVRSGGGSRSLDVSGPRIPDGGLGPAEKNLAYRAALAFVEHPKITMPRGFSIELTKKIPVGGGLGGGSADAGAVLRAMNAIAPQPLDAEDLRDVATSLGSDVPFLAGELVTATAVGRGELFQPFPTPNASPMAIIIPDFAIATKDAYAWLDHDRPNDGFGEFNGFGVGAPPPSFPGWDVFGEDGNDFEPVVEKRHPVLRDFREMLTDAGAVLSHLAGSGSSVFGVFDVLSWSTLDHDALGLDVAALGADVIHTRTSARVVEVEVLQ